MKDINRKIHVLGLNSFDFKELPFNLQNLYNKTIFIAAPEKYIEAIKQWSINKKGKEFFASNSDNKLINWLKAKNKDVVLISRGDPLWFGIGRILLQNFSKEELVFHPANTCIQIAFSRLKRPWQEASVVSVHGRDSLSLIKALKSKVPNLAIITDSKRTTLEIIRENIFELNLRNYYDFWLCEELGFENEKIRKINIQENLPSNISDLNLVILLKRDDYLREKNYPLFGLKDSYFKTFKDRPNLLTKREIRIQILADLELPNEGNIWDIGAGCGSIGLEALKLRPNLNLLCIDKRLGTKKLIEENAKSLNVFPREIIEQDINHLINNGFINKIASPNRVIIGGCDIKTKILLINQISKIMNKGDIIVVPIIDIGSIKEIKIIFIKNNFIVDLNLIQTYRCLSSISDGTRFEPNNPVFLFKGKRN